LIEENETNQNEMNIEEYVDRTKNGNLQTKYNKGKKNGEQIMKKFWKGHNKNALCWEFYCVNDGKEVEGVNHQVMRYILCYVDLVNVPNPRTKENKRFKNLL
jgi:hypothetical protein